MVKGNAAWNAYFSSRLLNKNYANQIITLTNKINLSINQSNNDDDDEDDSDELDYPY